MPKKKEISQNLIGCFEICLFMKNGVERFENSQKTAILSFIWPLIFLPIILYAISFQWTNLPSFLLYPFQATRILMTMGLFYGAVYCISKALNRIEYFYRFVTISNWINIPMMILIAPLTYTLCFHIGNYENLESYAIFTTLVSYVFTGFIATHTFRFPWEIGAFIAIISMGLNDISFIIADLILHGL